MNPLVSCINLTAAILLLSLSPGSSQTATARAPAATSAQKPHELLPGDEAKDTPSDAALLQQLDTTPSQTEGDLKTKDRYAPGSGGLGYGGKAGTFTMRNANTIHQTQNAFGQPAASSKALLVRTTVSSPEPKAQAALEEDLSIMAHILNKAAEEIPGGHGRPMNALGVELFYTPNSTPMRSLYLDNYGAVFFLNVGFPLVAPAEKPQDEKPAADSTWEDARQEIYGQRMPGAMAGGPEEDYSQEKVDKLKETLLESLKNATNIRELKPEEFVTIWVSGGASAAAGRALWAKNRAPGANVMVANPAATRSHRTILTIRVTKADADAYAKGKVSPQDFERHACITAYAGEPAGGAAEELTVGGYYPGRPRF